MGSRKGVFGLVRTDLRRRLDSILLSLVKRCIHVDEERLTMIGI